jgi:hypothetical protein
VTGYTDVDGDGYGAGDAIVACLLPDGTSASSTDCDDGDASIHPGATESCATDVDDDCDGELDANNATGCTEWHADTDADGYGGTRGICRCEASSTYTLTDGSDCTDTDAAIHPGAAETCNGADDDCDGRADEDLADCAYTPDTGIAQLYLGGEVVFSFEAVDQSRGCIAPGSLAQVGQLAFFLAEDGFYSFNGTESVPIGFGRVDKYWTRVIDQTRLADVRSTVDPFRKVIIWSAPDVGGDTVWFMYSYAANRWRFGRDAALETQAFVQRLAPRTDAALSALAASTFGWSAFLWQESNFGGVMQESDSFILVGSNAPATFVAAFDPSNKIVGFVGAPLAALIETGEADINGRRVLVSGLRPLTDAVAPTCAVGWRNQFRDDPIYTTATAQEVTGICPQRISARYARAVVSIPAGAPWSYLSGVDVIARPEGSR